MTGDRETCPTLCPGSHEARASGCRCPRMDNWNGNRHGWHVTVEGCPVHWPVSAGGSSEGTEPADGR